MVAGEVVEMLQRQKLERQASSAKQLEEQHRREARLRAFSTSKRNMYDAQWSHVQLELLPGDQLVDGKGVTEREPTLLTDLAELLRARFESLFDTYMYYAKVEEHEHAAELYRLTESSWKQLLRDAAVLQNEQYQLTCLSTTQASSIFKSVNQRRDNLQRGCGGGRGAPTPGTTNSAAVSAAVRLLPWPTLCDLSLASPSPGPATLGATGPLPLPHQPSPSRLPHPHSSLALHR